MGTNSGERSWVPLCGPETVIVHPVHQQKEGLSYPVIEPGDGAVHRIRYLFDLAGRNEIAL